MKLTAALPLLALLAATACDALPTLSSSASLVIKGDGRACSHRDALELLDLAIRGGFERSIDDDEKRALPLTFENIAMTSMDLGVKIECQANVSFIKGRTGQAVYELLPSSEEPGKLLIRLDTRDWMTDPSLQYRTLLVSWQAAPRNRSSDTAYSDTLRPQQASSDQPPSRPDEPDPQMSVGHPVNQQQTESVVLNSDMTANAARMAAQAVTTANERERRSAAANGEPAEETYRFQASAPIIRYADLDDDGDQDGVVLVGLCEEINCHATTESTVVALIKNDSGALSVAAQRVFEGPGEIVSISGRRVDIQTLEFGPDDPSCCASVKRSHRLELP